MIEARELLAGGPEALGEVSVVGGGAGADGAGGALELAGTARPDVGAPGEMGVGGGVQRGEGAAVRGLGEEDVYKRQKYARPGNPTRILVHTEPDSEAGWVRVSVADRGIGIPPADRERVFRPFSRSRRGEATGRSGIGLGLALCQAIVTRHGGRIAASGNEWGGTTMTFTLPEARAAVPT